MIELLIRLAAVILASAGMYLLFYLISLVQNQRNGYQSAAQRLEQRRKNRRIEVDPPRRPYRPATSSSRSPRTTSTYSPQRTIALPVVSTTHRELETRLVSMLGGNQETAIRLLKHVHHTHLDQNYQWCLEKAISDLLRDRRS